MEVLDGSTAVADPFSEVFLTDHRELAPRFDLLFT
jgi:hypothetical protein